MIRALIALAALLALSVGVNLAQWRGSIIDAEQRAAEITLAREQGRSQAFDETITRTSFVATMAAVDNATLMRFITDLVERSRERVTVYRDRIVTAPPLEANCAPGEIRVDAVNALLGHAQ